MVLIFLEKYCSVPDLKLSRILLLLERISVSVLKCKGDSYYFFYCHNKFYIRRIKKREKFSNSILDTIRVIFVIP